MPSGFDLGHHILMTFIPLMVFLIFLALQLLLCFKTRFVLIKLIPTILSLLLAIVSFTLFSIVAANSSGWDALGYFYFSYLSACTVAGCAIAWVIWVINRIAHKFKSRTSP